MLEVLKVLNSNENYFVKVVDNYNKIGAEMVDDFNLFVRNEIPTPTPFQLIGNDTRMNISVQQKTYGQVKINPIQAKKVGLDKVINGPMTYNTKTLIVDGILNVKKIQCIVCLKTYMQLKKLNVTMEDLDNTTSYPGKMVIIDLTSCPIISKGNYSLEDIYNNVNKINELLQQQKVLNALKIKDTENQLETIFTPEQIELLKEHGLNEDLNYIGVDVHSVVKEKYDANVITFKIKKSSSSSFNGMMKRIEEGKVLNALDQLQYDYYLAIQKKLIGKNDKERNQIIKELLTPIKIQLAQLRLQNTMIKLDMVNSNILETAPSYKDLIIKNEIKTFEK